MQPLGLIVVSAWVFGFWQCARSPRNEAGKLTTGVAILASLALGLMAVAQ